MTRKPRDYKAEYARRKARREAGLSRPRDYRAEYQRRKAKGYTWTERKRRLQRKTGTASPTVARLAGELEWSPAQVRTLTRFYGGDTRRMAAHLRTLIGQRNARSGGRRRSGWESWQATVADSMKLAHPEEIPDEIIYYHGQT